MLGPKPGLFLPNFPALSPLCSSHHTAHSSGKQTAPATMPPCPEKAQDPHLLPSLGVDSCREAAYVRPQGTCLQHPLQPWQVQLLPEANVLHHGHVLDPGLLGHLPEESREQRGLPCPHRTNDSQQTALWHGKVYPGNTDGGTHSWGGPCLKLCRLGESQTQPALPAGDSPRRSLRGSAG